LRSQFVRWHPRLRMVFLTQLVLWRYRARVPGFELPAPVVTALQEFDEGLAYVINRMADRLEGKASARRGDFEEVVRNLEKQVLSCCSKTPQGPLAAELHTFLALSRSIENVTLYLDNEIDEATLHDSP
jgi:multidrug resistance protein MdtO